MVPATMLSFICNLIPRLVLHQEAAEKLCRESDSASRRQVAPLSAENDIVESPTASADTIEVPLGSTDVASTTTVAEASTTDAAPVSSDDRQPSSEAHMPSTDDEADTTSSSDAEVDVEAPLPDADSESSSTESVETASTDVEALPSFDARYLGARAERVVKTTVNEIVNFPHETSAAWHHLSLILMIHALGPLAFTVVPIFFMRLSSVNEGLSHNRGFLYGIHTVIELFIIVAFIQTCHFAIPSAEIPLKARVTAVLVGLLVGKVLLVSIAETWWSRDADPVFPIPFSFIVAAVISLPLSLWTLHRMTPKRKEPAIKAKIQRRFTLCFLTLAAYMFCLFVVCLWGVAFRKLQHKPMWQSVWGVTFQVLQFLCKIPVVAPLVTRLNAKRWIQLSLVVDLIFVGVHTSMLPYFANWGTVLASLMGTMVSLIWRAYSGVDRVSIFGGMLWQWLTHSSSELGEQGTEIPIGLVRASVRDIHEISMSRRAIHGNGPTSRAPFEGAPPDDDSDDPEEPAVPMKRSDTQETESVSDCESVDSVDFQETESVSDCESVDSVDLNDQEEPSTPETAPMSSDSSVTTLDEEAVEIPIADRRGAFANDRYHQSRSSRLNEVDWKQRQCYHMTDSVSSAVLSTLVRVTSLIISSLVRELPVNEHLNASFQISDEQWRDANTYGWIFVVGTVLLLLAMNLYIRRLQLGGLTLNRIISYMFRDHFWFLFFWFCITQALAFAMMLNHFGADFTLDFDWLSCRGEGRMAWPGCV